jgi:hypothetical protein
MRATTSQATLKPSASHALIKDFKKSVNGINNIAKYDNKHKYNMNEVYSQFETTYGDEFSRFCQNARRSSDGINTPCHTGEAKLLER